MDIKTIPDDAVQILLESHRAADEALGVIYEINALFTAIKSVANEEENYSISTLAGLGERVSLIPPDSLAESRDRLACLAETLHQD